MATVNVMLRKSKHLKDGGYPLVIVITTGSNKRRYITVGSATEIQWNSSKGELNQKHSDFVRINRVINKRVSEIKDAIMEFEMRGDTPTIDDLVKPRASKAGLFKDVANDKRLSFLEAGKPGTYKRYGGIIDKFLEYAGESVRFSDITAETITGFKKFMEAKGNKANTIASNFVVIKGILKEGKLDVDSLFDGIRMREVDVLKQNGVSAEIRMQMVGHNSEKIHNKYHGEFDREKLSEITRDILSPKGGTSSSSGRS